VALVGVNLAGVGKGGTNESTSSLDRKTGNQALGTKVKKKGDPWSCNGEMGKDWQKALWPYL